MTEGVPIPLTEEQLAAVRAGAPLILTDGNGSAPQTIDPRRATGGRKLLWAVLGALLANASGIFAVWHRLDTASRDRFGGAHVEAVHHELGKRNTWKAMEARGGWQGLDAHDIVAIQQTIALRHDL